MLNKLNERNNVFYLLTENNSFTPQWSVINYCSIHWLKLFGINISRMNKYIETPSTGKGTAGAESIFIRDCNQPVSKQPIWTLIMDPNATQIFFIIDENGGSVSKTKIL